MKRPAFSALLLALLVQQGCSLIYDYPKGSPESGYAACHDGKDDDYDSLIDKADPDCAAQWTESTAETCKDGLDDDGNGETDCADRGCSAFCPEGTSTPGTCTDGVDNDADGLVDCDDAKDCAGSCPEDGSQPKGDVRCKDGVDNDGDGFTDGADPLCWSVLAPEAQRCSVQGTSLDERFDADPTGNSGLGFPPYLPTLVPVSTDTASPWYPFGAVQVLPPVGRSTRLDTALAPAGLGKVAFGPATTGGAGSRALVSGSWAGFELGFSVSIGPGDSVSVALVPVVSAAEGIAPRTEAELVDATVISDALTRTVTFGQGGHSATLTVPAPKTCGVTYCDGGFQAFRVVLRDGQFRATFAGLDLPPLPATGLGNTAPKSRVIVSGQIPANSSIYDQSSPATAYVDDVHASFAPSLPCGFFAPQMPAPSEYLCAVAPGSDGLTNGNVVSVAKGPDGYCALVSVIGSDRNTPTSTAVQTWRSTDSTHWQRGAAAGTATGDAGAANAIPSGDLPHAYPLVRFAGASVAWDPKTERWVAAVIADDDVFSVFLKGPLRVKVTESHDCVTWSDATVAMLAPDDTEPPSLLVNARGERDLYFTRPPNGSVGRTLWLTHLAAGPSQPSPPDGGTGSVPASDAAPILEFPSDLHADAPVDLQVVGDGNYVMTYRLDAAATVPGLGMAVSSDITGEWHAVSTMPILGASSQSGFDDVEILSGAVLWGPDGGALLYGARGTGDPATSSSGISGAGTAVLRVLAPSGSPIAADAGVSSPAPTSNGGDSGPSSDDGGPAATNPDGVSLLTDGSVWSVNAASSSFYYVDDVQQQLRLGPNYYGFGPGNPLSWLYRSTPTALIGDFQLSFDVRLETSSSNQLGGQCFVSVGLGPAPASPIWYAATPDGVFADVAVPMNCPSPPQPSAANSPLVSTHATVSGESFPAAVASCADAAIGDARGTQHVTLRRENGHATVEVARNPECGTPRSSNSTDYTGSLPDLDTLYVGGNCATVRNLSLVNLGDPAACEKTVCASAGVSACVDTQTNPEHCGSCSSACLRGQHCVGGQCSCLSGQLMCSGGCVDDGSFGNCGACGRDPCGDGTCVFGGCSADAGGSCANPFRIPSSGGTATVRLRDRTPGAGTGCFGAATEAVFAWTAPASGSYAVTFTQEDQSGSLSAPMLFVLGDSACAGVGTADCSSLVRLGFPSGAGGSLSVFDATEGKQYFLVVGADSPAPGGGTEPLNSWAQLTVRPR